MTVGTIALSGALMVVVVCTLTTVMGLAFVCVLLLGFKHAWSTCSDYVNVWIRHLRYQCWEYASYKEVWQSDRKSEPEELQSGNMNTSNLVESMNMKDAPQFDSQLNE